MVTLNSGSFKRNRKAIVDKINVTKKAWIAKETLYLYFPAIYVEKNLTTIDNVCSLFGLFIISDDKNNYSLSIVSTLIETSPLEVEVVDIDGDEFYKLTIDKGTPIINDLDVVVHIDMAYNTFDLFLVKGKVPFYIGYEDLLMIFKNLKKFTGSNVGGFLTIIKILIRISARDGNNLERYYNSLLKTTKDKDKYPVKWIGLSNVYFTFKSTLSKIAGSYMKKGIVSAKVKPEKKATDLENILRK